MPPYLTFSEALELLKQGKKVTNHDWHKDGMYLELQRPDSNSKMSAPYIYITVEEGYRVPWVASQYDLLSDKWKEV